MQNVELCQINRAAENPAAWVAACETEYRAKILSVRDTLLATPAVRLLLLAGPSASGKTTTANLLADAFREVGKTCEVISLDNFYKQHDDPTYPLLPNGQKDYECDEALDLKLIRETLQKVSAGEAFFVPHYDFKTGSYAGDRYEFSANSERLVIIEGLHALNPKIADALPHDNCRKMFISVSTNLTEGGVRLISGKKLRFVRRLVRDSLYRGANATRTYNMWQAVLAGEELYLYPYRDTADFTFDTFHPFEIGLMCPFALSVLNKDSIDTPFITTVRTALEKAVPVSESLVSQTSLMREFIPGGVYENLY